MADAGAAAALALTILILSLRDSTVMAAGPHVEPRCDQSSPEPAFAREMETPEVVSATTIHH